MINIYSQREIEKIAVSGEILANILKQIAEKAKIGTSLKELDDLAYKLIKEDGAQPAFLGYRPSGAEKPYGASICASVNEVVVHGLPNNYRLKNGDVLKIDAGIKYKNFYSDAAVTLGIGKISPIAEKLIKATRIALKEAIKNAQPGNFLDDIGWAVSKTAKKFGVKIVKNLHGHGIGRNLHEEPIVNNFKGKKDGKIELKPGMVLAIEPMFTLGNGEIIQYDDESWVTQDKSLSAHFEHTIAITKDSARILTSGIE